MHCSGRGSMVGDNTWTARPATETLCSKSDHGWTEVRIVYLVKIHLNTSARNDDKDESTVRSTHIYPGTCEPYRTSTAENAQTTQGLYPRPASKFHQAWPLIAFLDAGEILLKYSRLVLLLMHSKFKRLLRPVHFFSNIVACSSHFVAKWSFISIACILIPPSLLRLTRDKV